MANTNYSFEQQLSVNSKSKLLEKVLKGIQNNTMSILKLSIINVCILTLIACGKTKVPAPPPPPANPCIYLGVDTCVNAATLRTASINLNNNNQSIHSFGASDCWTIKFVGKNWPLEKRNQIADLLFSKDFDANGNPKGIGLSMWRINLGAGSFEQGDASRIGSEWRREECYQNAAGVYDWTKQAGNRWFAQAAKARGVEQLLMFSISAPVHLTKNGLATGDAANLPNRLNLKADKYDEYADFMAEAAKNYTQSGTPIDYISPINEPQWDWAAPVGGNASQEGTAAQNTECYKVVQELNSSILSKGLSTKIAFGEAGNHGHVYTVNTGARTNQLEYFWNPTSAGYLGNFPTVEKIISSHSYGSQPDVAKLISNRNTIPSKLAAVTGNTVKNWQTEYCILTGEDQTEGNVRDLGINSALYIARVIHTDLAIGNASAWHWWLGVSSGDYKDGLVYITNQSGTMGALPETKSDGLIFKSKMLWAMGNYSRFIRPGMIRVDANLSGITNATAAATSMMISAYKNPTTKELVTVVINYGTNEEKVKFSGVNYTTSTIKSYTTDALRELQSGTVSATSSISVGPRSITTYVGTYQ
jgi:O-glycosyl hydrolase